MPLDKNDLNQIEKIIDKRADVTEAKLTKVVDSKIGATETRLTKAIDEKIGASEKRLTGVIDSKITASEQRLTQVIDTKIEALATITKRGFDSVTKDIAEIKQEQRTHDFKMSETVTRAEHFQLKERVKKTELKLGLKKV